MRVKEGKDTKLTLFMEPKISELPVGQPITLCTERYDHLSQLELAESPVGRSQDEGLIVNWVRLLLGAHNW